jgi:hypothetical protein
MKCWLPMLKNSTFLYCYTLIEKEECVIYDLANLDPINDDAFAEVYQYLDSLCVEAPESLVRSILKMV